MMYTIYQWVGFAISVAGLAYAISGIGRVPFIGRSTYSDSVFTRVATGLGIAMVWPLLVAYLLLRKARK